MTQSTRGLRRGRPGGTAVAHFFQRMDQGGFRVAHRKALAAASLVAVAGLPSLPPPPVAASPRGYGHGHVHGGVAVGFYAPLYYSPFYSPFGWGFGHGWGGAPRGFRPTAPH